MFCHFLHAEETRHIVFGLFTPRLGTHFKQFPDQSLTERHVEFLDCIDKTKGYKVFNVSWVVHDFDSDSVVKCFLETYSDTVAS